MTNEISTLPKTEIEFQGFAKLAEMRVQQDRIFSAERLQVQSEKTDRLNATYYFLVACLLIYFGFSFVMSKNFIKLAQLHRENTKQQLIQEMEELRKEIKDYE